MADARILLPDDSANTGPKLDTSSLTVAANTVHRERMNIADPTTDVGLASVLNAAPTTEYGLVIRAAGTTKVSQTDGTNTETTLYDIDTGAGSQYAQGVNLRISASGGSIEAKGQQAMASSIPVALASNQSSIPVTLTSTTITGSVAVTNAGTFATQVDGAALTALQLIDNPVVVLGTDTYTEATSSGNVMGAVRRDADTTLVNTTNEFAPLQLDARGCLKVEAFSGEALPVTMTSTTITGSVAVTQSGTWDEVGINDSGNSITIDNAQLSVVGSGTEATALRVTIATDSTGLLSVDDNGSSLTVDNGGTFAVQVSSIAAGNNIIGQFKLTDGTTIADILDLTNHNPLTVAIVDGNGDQITSFGGGTQYAEDTLHASGDVMTMAGVVQQTADAALSGNGDRSLLQVDETGYLKVNIKAGGGTGGTSSADDSAFTVGSGLGTPAMGFFNDRRPDSVDEGDVGALRMSADRNLYTQLRDAVEERSARIDGTEGLVVSPGSLLLEVLNNIRTELRCIRLATVQMVTEAGSCRPEEFDPAFVGNFDLVDESVSL